MSITQVPVAHRSPVYALGTVQEPDGRWRIFTVGDDRRIRAWDAATGAEDGFSAPAPGPTVRSLLGADLGDAQLLVWANLDTVQRLDRHTGAPTGPPIRTVTAAIALAGSLIVTGSRQGVLSRWDLGTGEPVGEPAAGHDGPVTALAATTLPDGRAVIVSGGADRTVRRWDAMTGEPLGPPMTGHRGPVVDVCCAGSLIVTQAAGGAIRRWDAVTGDLIGRPLNQPAPHGQAGGLAITPDGQVLYSVDGTRTLHRRDESGVPQRLSAPVATVARLAMAGDMLVSATEQGVIRRWDRSGLPIGTPPAGHPARVHTLTTAAGAPAALLSAGADGARAWDAVTGAPIGDPAADPLPAPGGLAGVWLGDGRLIVATNADGALWRHDVRAGVITSEALDGEVAVAALAAVALPDGSGLLAAMTTNGEIRRLDAATGRPIAGGEAALTGHGDEGYEVAATTLPDGAVMIAGAGDDNRILRWDARTGEPIGAALKSSGVVMSLGFRSLPDGRVLLISCDDFGRVQRWEATTGAPVGETLTVGADPFVPLNPAAVEAGRLIAASSGERTRCWDAVTAERLGDLAEAGCSAVLTLPDGGVVLAAGHEDGSLEIIDLRSERP